jgi:iron uptake system component EfeO
MAIRLNFPAGRPLIAILAAAAGISSVPAAQSHAATLDAGIESYRSTLIADVDHTLASGQKLRAGAAAGDVAAAKRAWIEARVGWERSEVFTSRFVPELDRSIDAWPNGASGFHAIEARLFGPGRTDFVNEADELVRNLTELSARVRNTPLTPQALLDGVVQLAYEVGESKVDGGESRVSGTSLNDMRNNVDGIDVAWQTVFASAVEASDRQLAGDVQRSIDALKTMVVVNDLKQVEPDTLTAATEDLVVKLQNAATLLGLKRPALEADVQR